MFVQKYLQFNSTLLYTASQKNIPDIFDCNLKTDDQILIIFGRSIPDTTCHQMSIQCPFSFPPHPTFVSALPGESITSKITFYPMRYDCLINITCKNTFWSHFWHCCWHFIQLSIFQLSAVKSLEVLAKYANTGKEMLSPFIDSSINNVPLRTNLGCTGRFLTLQTFLKLYLVDTLLQDSQTLQ